ncbi:hypothetical protein Cni_G06774 [Canna indica]|uniref:Uncharacterized protein n=1 Tax=Canna indica TaxID=4628 RepID=A0AAQ3Q6V7_9LILI|nr:hypothetical protein Cni_G06774 [Canna indica]
MSNVEESVTEKQKRMAEILTRWNKNYVRNLESKLKDTLKLEELEKRDAEDDIVFFLKGQKVNLSKSEVYFPEHVNAQTRQMVGGTLKFKTGKYPMKFLGTFISPKRLEKKYRSDEACSEGKRKKAIKELTKVEMNYFWVGSNNRTSAKMISWEVITRNRRNGGLGIRDLSVIRRTAMSKRILPLLNKEDSSWCKILNSQKSRWHPWVGSMGNDQSRNGKAMAENLKCLRGGIKKCVANGKDTDIWADPWIDTVPLYFWPTYINVVEVDKLGKVNELIMGFGWKEDILERCFGKELIKIIVEMNVKEDYRKDSWVWIHSRDGKLSSKVDMLNAKKKIPWDLKTLIENIWCLEKTVDVNGWNFIKREENEFAHATAWNGVYGKASGIWRSRKESSDELDMLVISCNELFVDFLKNTVSKSV